MKNNQALLSFLIDHSGSAFNSIELQNMFHLTRQKLATQITQWGTEGFVFCQQAQLTDQIQLVEDAVSAPYLQTKLPKDLSIYLFDQVDSTQSLAKDLFFTKPQQEALIIANAQSQGRGRLGRSFYSQIKDGIYLTLVIPFDESFQIALPSFTLLVAVACLNSFEGFLPYSLQVKWVNDLYFKGKKVGGILTDLWTRGSASALAVGLGLNLAGDFTHTDSITQKVAGTLYGDQMPPNFSRNRWLVEFYNQIHLELSKLPSLSYLTTFQNKMLGIGEQVDYEYHEQKLQGIIQGIDESGRLLLLTDNREIKCFSQGEISLGSHQFSQ